MKKIKLVLVGLFFVSIAFSQPTENKKPFIEVTGSGETEIIPDEIYITITLQERQEGKDKLSIEKQEENLKQIKLI